MKKTRKIWIIPLILIVLLLLAAAWFFFFRGAAADAEGTAYVQSVAEITGQPGALLPGRYSGVVEAQEIVKVKLDTDKKLDECLVSVGDKVKAGTPLFSYDVDSLALSLEQLKLDYEGLKNNITTMNDQIKDLEKQVKKARSSTKAELLIQLQTLELSVKKEEYEAKKKRLAVEDAERVIADNVVKAEVVGTVRSITPPTTSGEQNVNGDGTNDAYITIVAGDDYRVKGTISEQSVHMLMVGTPVIIRSRMDEKQTWTGTITLVNTEQAEQNNNQNYYYDSNSGEQTSKYAFYVDLASSENLLMGQHVYIELDEGQESGASGLQLPEYYLIAEGDRHYVYAANARGRIEKRQVTVGAYNAELGTYEIVSGLTEADRIAFPDETVKPGMTAVDAGYADGGTDSGAGDGMMDGEPLDEGMADESGAAEPAAVG